MNLQNEFDSIREWALEKGILGNSTVEKQLEKFAEEANELSLAISVNDDELFIDAIGDCVVVLTNLAAMKGIKVEDCINHAYGVISKRKGKMVDGIFVKEN